MKQFFDVFMLLVIFALVCVAVYYTTRFVSVKSFGFSQSKYMKIIDKMALSKDKYLLLVEIGNECYLIGFSNQNMAVLDSVDKDLLTENEPLKINYPNEQVLNFLSKIPSAVTKSTKGFFGKNKAKASFNKNADKLDELTFKVNMRSEILRGTKNARRNDEEE